mgnify:CR=1 FL=1
MFSSILQSPSGVTNSAIPTLRRRGATLEQRDAPDLHQMYFMRWNGATRTARAAGGAPCWWHHRTAAAIEGGANGLVHGRVAFSNHSARLSLDATSQPSRTAAVRQQSRLAAPPDSALRCAWRRPEAVTDDELLDLLEWLGRTSTGTSSSSSGSNLSSVSPRVVLRHRLWTNTALLLAERVVSFDAARLTRILWSLVPARRELWAPSRSHVALAGSASTDAAALLVGMTVAALSQVARRTQAFSALRALHALDMVTGATPRNAARCLFRALVNANAPRTRFEIAAVEDCLADDHLVGVLRSSHDAVPWAMAHWAGIHAAPRGDIGGGACPYSNPLSLVEGAARAAGNSRQHRRGSRRENDCSIPAACHQLSRGMLLWLVHWHFYRRVSGSRMLMPGGANGVEEAPPGVQVVVVRAERAARASDAAWAARRRLYLRPSRADDGRVMTEFLRQCIVRRGREERSRGCDDDDEALVISTRSRFRDEVDGESRGREDNLRGGGGGGIIQRRQQGGGDRKRHGTAAVTMLPRPPSAIFCRLALRCIELEEQQREATLTATPSHGSGDDEAMGVWGSRPSAPPWPFVLWACEQQQRPSVPPMGGGGTTSLPGCFLGGMTPATSFHGEHLTYLKLLQRAVVSALGRVVSSRLLLQVATLPLTAKAPTVQRALLYQCLSLAMELARTMPAGEEGSRPPAASARRARSQAAATANLCRTLRLVLPSEDPCHLAAYVSSIAELPDDVTLLVLEHVLAAPGSNVAGLSRAYRRLGNKLPAGPTLTIVIHAMTLVYFPFGERGTHRLLLTTASGPPSPCQDLVPRCDDGSIRPSAIVGGISPVRAAINAADHTAAVQVQLWLLRRVLSHHGALLDPTSITWQTDLALAWSSLSVSVATAEPPCSRSSSACRWEVDASWRYLTHRCRIGDGVAMRTSTDDATVKTDPASPVDCLTQHSPSARRLAFFFVCTLDTTNVFDCVVTRRADSLAMPPSAASGRRTDRFRVWTWRHVVVALCEGRCFAPCGGLRAEPRGASGETHCAAFDASPGGFLIDFALKGTSVAASLSHVFGWHATIGLLLRRRASVLRETDVYADDLFSPAVVGRDDWPREIESLRRMVGDHTISREQLRLIVAAAASQPSQEERRPHTPIVGQEVPTGATTTTTTAAARLPPPTPSRPTDADGTASRKSQEPTQHLDSTAGRSLSPLPDVTSLLCALCMGRSALDPTQLDHLRQLIGDAATRDAWHAALSLAARHFSLDGAATKYGGAVWASPLPSAAQWRSAMPTNGAETESLPPPLATPPSLTPEMAESLARCCAMAWQPIPSELRRRRVSSQRSSAA